MLTFVIFMNAVLLVAVVVGLVKEFKGACRCICSSDEYGPYEIRLPGPLNYIY